MAIKLEHNTEDTRIFLSRTETWHCHHRNGGEWRRSDSMPIVRREIDLWLRANFGHKNGETWECDRFYYPEEALPELPSPGGRSHWKAKFKCWPDEHGRYHTHGWDTVRGGIEIKCPDNDPEAGLRKAVIFKMLFL